MCGRAACTLEPDQICKACYGIAGTSFEQTPIWRDVPGNLGTYSPNFNVCPSTYSPVLVSGGHFANRNDQLSVDKSDASDTSYTGSDVIVQPMYWSFIPSYYKGELKKFPYRTINARADSLQKSMFRTPLSNGCRCVAIMDGFYEWEQLSSSKKQPYFIYFPQNKNVVWNQPELENGGKSWKGRRLLTLAGIFSINHNVADVPLYSFTIITVETSKQLSFFHDRMPAVLEDENAVGQWLDYDGVPLEEALTLLKPYEGLDYHPVSPKVGNVREKTSDCILPYAEPVRKEKGQTSLFEYFKPNKSSSNTESSQRSTESSDSAEVTPSKLRKI